MGAVKKVFISWEDIELDVQKIVAQVSNVDYVVGIPRGGLIIAVMISHRLGVKHMTIDHLEKLEEFGLDIDKKKILVVDDISDSGQTIKRYIKEGYTTATLDVRHTTVAVPEHYANWIDNTNWIVYPWERKDSKTVQDYLDN
jgi:hypoxanthine phosphoribosyltransferase|tara:strand:+ start:210 stop:635 length:426 start_codon:yes stop_codon:yes gene_type:complete